MQSTVLLAAALAVLAGCAGQTGTPVATLDSGSPPVATTAAPAPRATAQPAPTTPAARATAEPQPTATASPMPAPSEPAAALYEWVAVVDGLRRPTSLAVPGDGSDRLFVSEQAGLVRVIDGGALREQPFLDLRQVVGTSGSEQGLLCVVFDPDYATNGLLYVNYTDLRGDTVVARYSVSTDNPTQADPTSAQIVLSIAQPYANHNGGQLQFGPDGYLYIGMGDGGAAGDPEGRAQNPAELLGKLLRIDVHGGEPYAVPDDNPFVGARGYRPEIWATGLRNPWRFSFDRATGDLYLADVGQRKWEEINFIPAAGGGGDNYGWDYREGQHPFEGSPPAGEPLVEPVAEYSHDQGCSVSGGYVYRGSALPALRGVYFYGDYCSGLLWALWRDDAGQWQFVLLAETGFAISSFGEDAAGELYLLDHAGVMYRLQAREP